MNIDNIIENITRKQEHDTYALELEAFIKDSIEKSHYSKCTNKIHWKSVNTVRKSEKELLIRHGYTFKEDIVPNPNITFDKILNRYDRVICIVFDKGNTCKYDKRMMDADEMFNFYEIIKNKKDSEKDKIIAEEQLQNRKRIIDIVYNRLTEQPSYITIEKGDYYHRYYNCYNQEYDIYMEVIENIKQKIPDIIVHMDEIENKIILSIPKKYMK